jgi:hypothetical protein
MGGNEPSVVIVYEHALLGEGIARELRTRAGVQATVASARDVEAVSRALTVDPSIVIHELSGPLPQGDLADLFPRAILVDVSTAVSRGWAAASAPRLESILEAVLELTEARGSASRRAG